MMSTRNGSSNGIATGESSGNGESNGISNEDSNDSSNGVNNVSGDSRGATVLVTGGAGYAGSHTVLLLLQKGYQVVVVDNCVNCAAPRTQSSEDSSSGSSVLPPSLNRVVQMCGKTPIFYQTAVDNKSALTEIFRKHTVSTVIHFAALKAVGVSVQDPLSYYRNNITGTITLLDVMTEVGVRSLVFSSSATVYGTPQFLPLDESHPVGQNITNPYGHTKQMCEQILRDVSSSDKSWRIVLLRYFNPVGAHPSGRIGEDPMGPPNNLVPYIAQVAVGRRDTLTVYGDDFDTIDGTGVRDYIHVMDLAEGHVCTLSLLEDPQFSGCRAFNLGTGRGVSVFEMVAAFSKACGRTVNYTVTGRRPGDCATVVAACGRASKELGWTAKRTLEDVCVDTWRWQSSNPYGYNSN